MNGKLRVDEKLIMKDQIAHNTVQEDSRRAMIMKNKNLNYKKVKEGKCCALGASPWGDFPKRVGGGKRAEREGANDPFSDVTVKKQFSVSGTRGRRNPLSINTLFRNHYDRELLPVKVLHVGSTNKILWTIEPNKVDLREVLPVFMDGLREKIDPYRLLAILGTFDLIEKNTTAALIEVVPLLIQPLRLALNTRDVDVIAIVCKVLLKLLTQHPSVGRHLVPYYRQLLPVFNLLKLKNLNIGDKIEYGQQKGLNISDLMDKLLNLMEKTGGDDAFINIKYMIPTYESCIYI